MSAQLQLYDLCDDKGTIEAAVPRSVTHCVICSCGEKRNTIAGRTRWVYIGVELAPIGLADSMCEWVRCGEKYDSGEGERYLCEFEVVLIH